MKIFKKVAIFLGWVAYVSTNITQKCKGQYILSKCKSKSKDCHIGSFFSITNPENLQLGNNVFIGDYAFFMCAKAKIKIGNHVIIAPNCSIITGNHKINEIGKYIDESVTKSDDYDQEVIIEDDVWIGKNVLILKGVTIGKGSVIGAGSIITKNVSSYAICFPLATVERKKRFNENEILKHEEKLNEIGEN